jgi:hypothetical protein
MEGPAMTKDGEEFVVLQDQQGHYYLLPRRALDGARVADESVERLRELMGGEVAGYVIALPQSEIFSQRGIIIIGGRTGLSLSGINFQSALRR